MAHSLSAKKRLRQNIKQRARNRAQKSTLKTQVRRFTDAVHDKNVEGATEQLRLATKKLDQLGAKGMIHRNAAARKKSRLARRLNKITAPESP